LSASSWAYDVVIQSDRRIVAGGLAVFGEDENIYDFALARYLPNGSLDSTFGGDGRVSTDFGDGDFAFGLALQPDGKLVAAGITGGTFALARYKTA
jgi:uncharacterized delta-60 repeat protein